MDTAAQKSSETLSCRTTEGDVEGAVRQVIVSVLFLQESGELGADGTIGIFDVILLMCDHAASQGVTAFGNDAVVHRGLQLLVGPAVIV